jgi:hypothetical protein
MQNIILSRYYYLGIIILASLFVSFVRSVIFEIILYDKFDEESENNQILKSKTSLFWYKISIKLISTIIAVFVIMQLQQKFMEQVC